MSKRIMIGNHNSNNNKTQTQMRNTQQHTDNIDELLESILRKKTYLQQTYNSIQ